MTDRKKYNPIVHHNDNRIFRTITKDGSVLDIFEFIEPWNGHIKYEILINETCVFDKIPLGEILASDNGKAKCILDYYLTKLRKHSVNREDWISEIEEIINNIKYI